MPGKDVRRRIRCANLVALGLRQAGVSCGLDTTREWQRLPNPETSMAEKKSTPWHTSKEHSQHPGAHGPLVGFYQGLSQITNNAAQTSSVDWLLLLACDLPNLQPDVIHGWCGRLAETPLSTVALLPSHPTKGWHPLCGFYRHRCLESLKTFIDKGGRSFQKWLANEDVQPLPVSNPAVLFNCNTPEDLARLHK